MAIEAEKVWLKQYPEELPASIPYDEKPLSDYLVEAAQTHPQKMALHFLGKELTYKELYESALKLGNHLLTFGLEKGDRVAVMLPNCPQAVISYYGILLAGGVVVQTNPLYTKRELKHQLHDADVKMMICFDLVYPAVLQLKDDSSLTHIIVTSMKDYLPFPKNILYPFIQKKQQQGVVIESSTHTFLFKNIMKQGVVEKIKCSIDPKTDTALLQYTGGTTGLPKGVVLTHFNLVANTQQCRAWLYENSEEMKSERILAILPFFHVYGMTVVMNFSIMTTSKMIILPQFNPKDVLKTIQKQKPTLFPGAPTMYIALLNHPEIQKYDLSSITACMSGAAPLPVEVQQKFEAVTNGKLVEGYGLTEASPVTHSNLMWGRRVQGSIGLPWPDTEAVIVNEEGNVAEHNEIGELVVRGPQIMQGYWKRPQETDAVLKDGWLYTGDMGYMDEEGYFYLVDRKSDLIIASGYNIYPREIEEVLYEHECVKEAVAIGVPDEYRGETVKAFVVLKEGTHCTEKELDTHCRKHLAAYKAPQIYEFRSELPKTNVGKVLRRVLIEEELAKLEERN